MGRKSQEKMTGKTYAERKTHAGSIFSRMIRALKKANRDRVANKSHPYGIGNASRDGIPKTRPMEMPVISLKRDE